MVRNRKKIRRRRKDGVIQSYWVSLSNSRGRSNLANKRLNQSHKSGNYNSVPLSTTGVLDLFYGEHATSMRKILDNKMNSDKKKR